MFRKAFQHGCFRLKRSASLLAVLAVLLAAPAGRAEQIFCKNETKGSVVVQATCVFGGMLKRDRPYLLNPGDNTPGIQLPGNKVITVYDAKNPNRVLYQVTIQASNDDQSYAIIQDNKGNVTFDRRTPPKK
jgi:hypothetical protein